MALFGRRCLPHRSRTLVARLSDVDRPCARSGSHALRAADVHAMGGHRKPLAASSRCQAHRSMVFDVDATRQAARPRALPCDPARPSARRRLEAVCAPGYRGRKRGEVVRTRTTARSVAYAKIGSARMQARARAIIAVNWPRHSKPSRPI